MALLIAALLAIAGCGGSDEPPTEVVLVTHDSFAISKEVKQAFEAESGLTLKILKAGDAGEVVTRALLTAGNPEGDVLFGDRQQPLAARARRRRLRGVRVARARAGRPGARPRPRASRDTRSTAATCASTTTRRGSRATGWRRRRTLADLTLPRYRGLLVVENPATSTPGLAFMLATIAKFGDGWQGYWRKLRANDVLVVDGWEDAYYARFSGAAGSKGKRPWSSRTHRARPPR